MKTLVIHPDDRSTDFLCPIYLTATNRPKFDDVKILYSSTLNTSPIVSKPGGVISIHGVFTDGGFVGYVDASIIPRVNVLYVGTTKKSNFNVGMLTQPSCNDWVNTKCYPKFTILYSTLTPVRT